MTKASDNVFPKVILDGVTTAPAAPSNDNWKMYAMVDGVYARSSNTIVGPFGASGGAVATDAIWDAAGDLAVGSGANTAARLAIGATNGMALRRVSGSVAWDLPPGHEFDYVERTTNYSTSTTSEGTATNIIAGNAVTYDGSTVVIIEAFFPRADVAATGTGIIDLYVDSTILGRLAILIDTGSWPLFMRFRHTPSSGSRTYTIKGWHSTAAATLYGGLGGTADEVAAFLRVTKA